MLLKSPVVVKALVNHADGNDGVHQIEVPSDLEVGRKNQGDAVPQCEHRDKFSDVLESGQKEDHTEQEQQMVISREHVACTQTHVLEVTTVKHALAVFF